MTFSELITQLEAAFDAPLPGPAAQAAMSPQPPREWPAGVDPSRVRHAAGLLLLFPIGDRPHLVLTVRSDTLGRHSGQVSLPGGVVDPGESHEQAALREAHEEVGLTPAGVRTLGALTPIEIRVSGFRLHPIVGAVSARPALRPSDVEVARILELPVDALLSQTCLSSRILVRDEQTIFVPMFVIEGAEIWGATAMVLAEFLTMIGWAGR